MSEPEVSQIWLVVFVHKELSMRVYRAFTFEPSIDQINKSLPVEEFDYQILPMALDKMDETEMQS